MAAMDNCELLYITHEKGQAGSESNGAEIRGGGIHVLSFQSSHLVLVKNTLLPIEPPQATTYGSLQWPSIETGHFGKVAGGANQREDG